jgi:hypothetical protein
MTPIFVLPESVARQDGAGAEFALEANRGKPLLLTLGITRIIQQESLEISIWGSVNMEHWKMLHVFPRKFYCGTYTMLLDLTRHPEVKYLRAQWNMNCWGSNEHEPLFGFYLLAEEPKLRAVGAA